MTRGRFHAAAALVALALLALAVPASADIKVGIVDLQRALNESAAGKKAKEQFKGEFDKTQNALKGEKDRLDRMKDDLDKQSVVLSAGQPLAASIDTRVVFGPDPSDVTSLRPNGGRLGSGTQYQVDSTITTASPPRWSARPRRRC